MWFSKKSSTNQDKNYVQQIHDMLNAFKDDKQVIIDTAEHSEKGGGVAWGNILNEYSVTSLSIEEKEEALHNGVQIDRGALPMEVQSVLQVLKARYEEKCSDIRLEQAAELRDNEEIEEKLWHFEHRVLSEFIEKDLQKYINTIKAPATIHTAFANAKKSQNKYSHNLQSSKTYTVKCKQCGAARLEEDQYTKCSYCGADLFIKA